MRLTRFRLFLLLGGSLLLLGPAVGLGQPGNWPGGPPPGGPPGGFQGGPPGGDQQGGGRRMSGFRMDPNMIFNMMAPNSDFLTEAQYLANPFVARDPNAKDRIESFMQRMGITNGGLTRDQFGQFFQERMAQRQAERDAARAASPDGQNPAAPGSPSASADAATDDGEPPPPEDKRPVVYRAGNLPTDIPSWFASLDTDRDGQVGLYEWKAAGRSISEFQAIDLNGDGFITVEEAQRYQKTQGAAVASGAPGAPSFGQPSSGQPSFGPPQGGFTGGQGNNGFRRRRGGPPGN